MQDQYIEFIARQLDITPRQVDALQKLFKQQATIPFIARYRKEATGNMDEETIQRIASLLAYFDTLDKRKQYILKVITDAGKLTATLKKEIDLTLDSDHLEDIFLPYKPGKKSRAAKAREAGLLPIALEVFEQPGTSLQCQFSEFRTDDYPTDEAVKQGIQDIIADIVATDKNVREYMRQIFWKKGSLKSHLKKTIKDAGKYENFVSYRELLSKIKNHRVLAVYRGAKDDVLSVGIDIESGEPINFLKQRFLKGYGDNQNIVKQAIENCYTRLIHPSIENETLRKLKEKADKESIRLFSNNLRQLLMAPPLGEKRVMAIDPGYRSGCKVVCLDEQGNLLHNETIFPHPPQRDTKKAVKKVSSLTDAYQPGAIAIGNGTASKETEQFIRRIHFTRNIEVYMVNEDGASVYSASKTAREEFPEYDVTVRGAISIGRRLLDPLGELIKIDPKSIGVGQYQHDVDQKILKTELDKTVFSCVNEVGVNLNTASYHLLSYVSGLTPALAKNIVAYRKANGKYNNRQELLKVTRLGPKAYEQAAGFLRISGGTVPLDNTGVHPESYAVVKRISQLKNIDIFTLIERQITLTDHEQKLLIQEGVGEFTLNDIVREINQPGIDPRGASSVFTFNQHIKTLEDLHEGMRVPAIVTNITDFGAFVDIGIKQNGLVHISEIAAEFISHPSEKLYINQQLILKVIHVDLEKERIQLSLKNSS